MTDTFGSSLRTIQAGLRRRDFSAWELTRLALERLDTYGRSLNAVSALVESRAERSAKAADRALRNGEPLSSLHGIPYGAKDVIAAVGAPTTWGSPAYRDRVLPYDAFVIQRLEQAGAILVGKLATVEFAGAGRYRSAGASLTGPCLNPWDTARWTGGSSSGSGAAVAASLVPFALGSDTSGSITGPSGYCGVTGLRPSFGTVSHFGVMPLSWSMDMVGPVARSARDCRTVLSRLRGVDDRDATTVTNRTSTEHRSPSRIGLIVPATPYSPDVQASFAEAVHVMEGLGMRCAEVTLPAYDYEGVAAAIKAGDFAVAHAEFIRSTSRKQVIDDAQREAILKNLERPLDAYVTACEQRVRIARDLHHLFTSFDAIVAPTNPTVAIALDADLRGRPLGFGTLAALAGLPSMSMPIRPGAGRLPVGLWLAAKPFGDDTILRIGERIQAATRWHAATPPVVSLEPGRHATLAINA